MNGIALGLAGALAAGALLGTPQPARAQGYYVYGPPPVYAAPPGYYGRGYAPGIYPPPYFDDRGDPLHRYYTPGYAPNVNNPSVSPSYQAPHVDDGTINGKGGRG